jgi:hypothetical protein
MSDYLETEIRVRLKKHKERNPVKVVTPIVKAMPVEVMHEILIELGVETFHDVERKMREESAKSVNGKSGSRKGKQPASRIGTVLRHKKREVDDYEQLMNAIVAVPGKFSKPFRHCTRADIGEVKAMYRKTVMAGQHNYDRYDGVERLFIQHPSAKDVGGLPEKGVRHAMK